MNCIHIRLLSCRHHPQRKEMLFIYGTSTSSFPDDGYGVSTDNPPSPYELIDEHLTSDDEAKIYDEWVEFREEIASRYFNTNEWDDYWWDAWIDKLKELI